MYRPPAFRIDDEAFAVVDARPLAQLVVIDADGRPAATPVPLVRRGDALVGHLARGNPVWKQSGPALAIFAAADAYVSPRWYVNKPVDGKVVPTWNYTTVHVHGTLVAHDDPGWTLDLVTFLTDRMEANDPAAGGAAPWRVADAPADYVDGLVRAIVGIELVGLRVEGKAKLSQNRDATDRARVTAGLANGSSAAQAVALAMQDSGS